MPTVDDVNEFKFSGKDPEMVVGAPPAMMNQYTSQERGPGIGNARGTNGPAQWAR